MDTLAYIRPKVYTLVIGQAFGNAAMIVACGAKGCRFATPNSRLMTGPPRLNRNFGTTKNIMIRANELENNTQVGAQSDEQCLVPESGWTARARGAFGLGQSDRPLWHAAHSM